MNLTVGQVSGKAKLCSLEDSIMQLEAACVVLLAGHELDTLTQRRPYSHYDAAINVAVAK